MNELINIGSLKKFSSNPLSVKNGLAAIFYEQFCHHTEFPLLNATKLIFLS